MKRKTVRKQMTANRTKRDSSSVLDNLNVRVIAALGALVVVALLATGFAWLRMKNAHEDAQLELDRYRNPPCTAGTETLNAVADDRDAHRYELALERAETALDSEDPPLCAEARARLVKTWYRTAQDVQYRMPESTWYDPQEQAKLLRNWEEVERQADAYGVAEDDRLSSVDVFRKARSAGQHLVADWAYRKAAGDGLLDAIPPKVRMDFLIEYGRALKDSPVLSAWQHAQVVLRTAVAIGDRYGFDTAEVCEFLSQNLLNHKDCRGIHDPTEPLLESAGGG